MTMNINNLGNHSVHTAAEAKAQSSDAKKQPQVQAETGKPSTADTVSLSGTARHLGQVSASMGTTPVFDSQRVEQIKQALRDGTYQIQPERIADQLMQLDTALSTKTTR